MSGWYKEMVWGKSESGFTASYSPADENEMFDYTNRDTVCIDNRWRSFEGVKVRYKISADIKQDKFDVVVYDITDVKFESIRSTEDLNIVYTQTIDSSGTYELDMSRLPNDKWYSLTIYCEEESDFFVEVTCDWDVERWMYLHDKYLTKLPFVEIKYNPMQ
jgi:predicted  nucleic acid-binding Zn-ribbon protein